MFTVNVKTTEGYQWEQFFDWGSEDMSILRQPPDGSTCCVCVQSKLFKPRLCILDNDIIIPSIGAMYVPIGHRLILSCNELRK